MVQNTIIHEDENPFSDEYHRKCIELYGTISPQDEFLSVIKPIGRLNRYFTMDFVVDAKDYINFKIDGDVWMSLTPMELESHWVPIITAQRIGGKIGIGGLGMGHILLNIMGHSTIDSITVYEKNETVINWWKERFKDHEGFDKIDFVLGDIYDSLNVIDDTIFDFFYMDIYKDLLCQQCFDDAETHAHIAKHYFFWGIEKVIYDGIFYEMFGSDVRGDLTDYLNEFNPFISSLFIHLADTDNNIGIGGYSYNEYCETVLLDLMEDHQTGISKMSVDYE